MAVHSDAMDMVDRDDIELRDIDERILDLLEEGWRTRQYLASELDVSGEYIYQRVDPLIRIGIVEKVHDGFYRLADSADERGTASTAEPDHVEGSDSLPEQLEDALADYREHCEVNDPGRADARVAAARGIMTMLVDEDGVGRAAAQDALLPEHDVDGQNAQTWWDKNGKRLLGDLDCVEWQSGRNEYVYTG